VVGEHEAGGRRVGAGVGTMVGEAQGERPSPSSGTVAAWEKSRVASLGDEQGRQGPVRGGPAGSGLGDGGAGL
jgi:hypothetical protein